MLINVVVEDTEEEVAVQEACIVREEQALMGLLDTRVLPAELKLKGVRLCWNLKCDNYLLATDKECGKCRAKDPKSSECEHCGLPYDCATLRMAQEVKEVWSWHEICRHDAAAEGGGCKVWL